MIPKMFKAINVLLTLVLASYPETTEPIATPIGIKFQKICYFILRANGASAATWSSRFQPLWLLCILFIISFQSLNMLPNCMTLKLKANTKGIMNL